MQLDSALAGDAVLPVVVFVVAGERCALAADRVERVLPMAAVSPLPDAPAIVLGVLNIHGRITPVIDLRRRLGLPSGEYGVSAHLVVARASGRTVALAVDEVLGLREVASEDVSSPDAVLSGIGQVAGVVALADGLLVVYDLDSFLSLDEERLLSAALEGVDG